VIAWAEGVSAAAAAAPALRSAKSESARAIESKTSTNENDSHMRLIKAHQVQGAWRSPTPATNRLGSATPDEKGAHAAPL
jgi:hypothetical protein